METKEVVIRLLRRELWGEAFEDSPDIDWPSVHAELKSQAVASLVDNVLMECCHDPALKREWSLEIIHRLNYNAQNMFGQDSLLALLKEEGIPAAILKGAAAARFYPHPEKRTLGDVDVLVSVDSFEDVLALLKENGYQQRSELIDGYCEVLLEKDQVLFELHRGLNDDDGVGVEAVDSYALEGLKQLEQCTINGHTFSVLPEPANGLVLLSHIRQHLMSGLGLRQIIDWMIYVYHSVDDEVWNDSFQAAARQCGLEKLAINVTRMCQMYLGLTEDITWCASAGDAACASLMDYIFERGNFGKKVERYERIAQRAIIQKNYLWKRLVGLQSQGLSSKTVKRHPVLRPFAWAIQLGYHVNQVFKRGNIIKTLRSDKVKARQMKEMFEALGILE